MLCLPEYAEYQAAEGCALAMYYNVFILSGGNENEALIVAVVWSQYNVRYYILMHNLGLGQL